MNALRAVFIYEWKRSLTLGRIGWWLAMAAFPVMITILIRTLGDSENQIDIATQKSTWSMTLYALIPGVCVACGFGTRTTQLGVSGDATEWHFLVIAGEVSGLRHMGHHCGMAGDGVFSSAVRHG